MLNSFKAKAGQYYQKNSTQIIYNGLIILGVCLLLGIFSLAYNILCWALPPILSILITFYLFYKFIYTLCRAVAFPGSTWYWRRNIENYFQKAFATQIKKKVKALRNLVEYVLEERAWHNFYNESEMENIRDVMFNTIRNFHKQVNHRTLNKRQKEFMEYFISVEKLLKQTKIVNKVNGRQASTWTFLGGILSKNTDPSVTVFCFEDKNHGRTLLERCATLEENLHEIICKKPWYQSLKRWMFEEAFGTLNQLREELDNRYKCKPLLIRSDNQVLDCMLISGHSTNYITPEELESNQEITGHIRDDSPTRNQLSDHTLIFCCPNAGYYEYMYDENQWVEFYLSNGFNVLLWNYRGYGRSSGIPDPNSFRKDGEAVVDYLRGELGMKKIAVHGESLGGIVTTHLGRAKNVDFICADRTFTSLSKVAEISFGRNLSIIFKLFTLWDDRIFNDYYEARCYKIITFDPRDEIIHLLSSLKQGVMNRILQQKLGLRNIYPKPDLTKDINILSPSKYINFIQKLIQVVQLHFNQNKLEDELNHFSELLSKRQMLALYSSVHRISELYYSVATQNPITVRRRSQSLADSNSINPSQASRVVKPGGDNDDDSNQQNPLPKDTGILHGSKHQGISLNGHTEQGDDNALFANEVRSSDENVNERNSNQFNDSFLTEAIHRVSYLQTFDEDVQTSDSVINILVRIHTLFENIETGGVFLSDVMLYQEEYRYQIFKHFINSFEIWGSYFPLLKITDDKAAGLGYHQTNAIVKLMDFLKKIEKVIKKETKKNQNKASGQLASFLLNDLETIHLLMTNLHQALLLKSKKPSFSTNHESRPNSFSQEGIELELENYQETQSMLRTSIASSDLEANSLNNYSHNYNVGCLIPLSCGHNGVPRPNEMKLFSYLFKNANISR